MSDELRKCPFCGSEVHRVDGDDSTAHDIECDECAYIFYDVTIGDGWWNDRPLEDALLARATKAEADKRDALVLAERAEKYSKTYQNTLRGILSVLGKQWFADTFNLPAEIAQLVTDKERAVSTVERLIEALEAIRDLARTGLAPVAFGCTSKSEWNEYKVNKIAGEADALVTEWKEQK